jgi:hypothetical protein
MKNLENNQNSGEKKEEIPSTLICIEVESDREKI